MRVLLSRLCYPSARLIRRGFVIRGREMVDLGTNLTTGYNCRLEAFLTGSDAKKKIVFGNNVQLNDNVHISSLKSVILGNDVLVASHCYISDNSHGFYNGNEEDTSPLIKPVKRPYMVSPVCIGDNVWIGEGVIIMPGVTVGNGAVIGAHSVVKNSIPDNCIAVGAPAKIIKKWDSLTERWIKVE